MQQKYIFTLPMKVRDYEVDAEGIVNNAIYLHYFEHTRHEFCEHAGMSFAQMHAQGIDPVLNRVEIDYLHASGEGSLNQMCVDLSIPVSQLMAMLMSLEFAGHILTYPGGKYRPAR